MAVRSEVNWDAAFTDLPPIKLAVGRTLLSFGGSISGIANSNDGHFLAKGLPRAGHYLRAFPEQASLALNLAF